MEYENQKIEFCRSRSKMEHTPKETSPQTKKWPRKKAALIVGDSMLSGIDERRITQKSDIKVRLFPGATTQNM